LFGLKGVHEFDAGTGVERCEESIHAAVDVVERENMEETVGRGV